MACASNESRPNSFADMTVMSFNIRYGTADDGENNWSLRRGLVVDAIRNAEPDLLGLQEALRFQLDYLRDELRDYGEVGVGRDDGAARGEYAAILYRTSRFSVAEQGTFWLSDTPDVPGSTSWGNTITRICTWARLVDRGYGQGFYVLNVHFDHESQPSRERSALLVASRIRSLARSEPVILTGDFNAGEDNPVQRYLTGEDAAVRPMPADAVPSPRFRDTYRVRHPSADSVGTFHGFRGTTAGEKIDAILVSDHWTVSAADIVRWSRQGRYPSDHFPVVATLIVEPGA